MSCGGKKSVGCMHLSTVYKPLDRARGTSPSRKGKLKIKVLLFIIDLREICAISYG